MEWHVNDLSLAGQFASPHNFRESLEPILQLRQRRVDLRSRIFCSRTLYLRQVTADMNLQQAIYSLRDQTFTRLALGWFANAGPFWDDSRAQNPNDYFEYGGQDVTDQGLGEAARRRLLDISSNTFSFLDPPANSFRQTPLGVTQGLPQAPLGRIEIANAWVIGDIETTTLVLPSSWPELLAHVRATMNLLIISPRVLDQLRPYPFHSGIARRLIELLDILQNVAQETLPDLSLSEAGMTLRQQFFEGEKASFTDESDTNKRLFHSELTFPDPEDRSVALFCPWHGKVKVGQYRIHFDWPRSNGQRQIKVLYMGPKITKR